MYEEAVSHIRLCNRSLLDFLTYEENFVFFFISVSTLFTHTEIKLTVASTVEENSCAAILTCDTHG
jgi:hypothetical protein